MTSSASTGPTVPAWIRDRAAEPEEAWTSLAVAAEAAAAILVQLMAGAILWTSDVVVCYARP